MISFAAAGVTIQKKHLADFIHPRSRFSRTPLNRFLHLISAALFGFIRRWNQTGQKYVGDPDIGSTVLSKKPWLLWPLVVATYVLCFWRLSKRVGRWRPYRVAYLLPGPVCFISFAYKVASAATDAPELLAGVYFLKPLVRLTSRYILVTQARLTFLGLAHLFACAMYFEEPWKRQKLKKGTQSGTCLDI